MCMITWSWDMLTCDALPNPLAESGKDFQKICFYKLPSSVRQFFLYDAAALMLLLKYSAIALLIRGRRREEVYIKKRIHQIILLKVKKNPCLQ